MTTPEDVLAIAQGIHDIRRSIRHWRGRTKDLLRKNIDRFPAGTRVLALGMPGTIEAVAPTEGRRVAKTWAVRMDRGYMLRCSAIAMQEWETVSQDAQEQAQKWDIIIREEADRIRNDEGEELGRLVRLALAGELWKRKIATAIASLREEFDAPQPRGIAWEKVLINGIIERAKERSNHVASALVRSPVFHRKVDDLDTAIVKMITEDRFMAEWLDWSFCAIQNKLRSEQAHKHPELDE